MGDDMLKRILVLPALCALLACAAPTQEEPGGGVDYAIVIHGGAGLSSGSLPPAEEADYREALERALRAGLSLLAEGGSSLDAVERVLRIMEDDPAFNAGKGAVFSNAGKNELDASIMDGATLACGAVAGVTNVKNPISLARLVMERTDHVLLSSAGAEQFAGKMGVELVEQSYFYTEKRWESLQRSLDSGGGTVGAAALDRRGNLAAGTSTGGLTNKMFGRVGDSPIIGAGTYADNDSCAISCTGKGEEFIRRSVAFQVSALMKHAGLSLREASEQVIHQQLNEGDGGLIGVTADGQIAMVFNTRGMFRGAADSAGRFEIRIWR
jgi:beta-aspartyl-peptidase (threonine type)